MATDHDHRQGRGRPGDHRRRRDHLQARDAPATKADVKVGTEIKAQGTLDGDTFTAISIDIELPHIAGLVTAKTGEFDHRQAARRDHGRDPRRGRDHVQDPGQRTPSLADIAVGDGVSAEGTLRANGSIDAVTVHAGTFKAKKPHKSGVDDDATQAPTPPDRHPAYNRAMVWDDTFATTPDGRDEPIELVGTNLRLTGIVNLGRFGRLSDLINASSGYVRVRNARLLRRNGDPTKMVLPELMVDQDEISYIAQTEAPTPEPGAAVGFIEPAFGAEIEARKPRQFVMFTPGHAVTGKVHVFGETDLAGFVDSRIRASSPSRT